MRATVKTGLLLNVVITLRRDGPSGQFLLVGARWRRLNYDRLGQDIYDGRMSRMS